MSKTFLLGMLAGCLVGTATGLLLAPYEDEVARREIAGATSSARRSVGDFASNMKQKVRRKSEVIRQAI